MWSPLRPKFIDSSFVISRSYDPITELGAQKNDQVLVFALWNGTSNVDSPVGWDVEGSDVHSGSGLHLGVRIFSRVLDGTEVSTQFIDSSSSRQNIWGMSLGPTRYVDVFSCVVDCTNGNPSSIDIDPTGQKVPFLWIGLATAYNTLGGNSPLVAADLVITGATEDATLSDLTSSPLRSVIKYGMMYNTLPTVNVNMGDISGFNGLAAVGVRY